MEELREMLASRIKDLGCCNNIDEAIINLRRRKDTSKIELFIYGEAMGLYEAYMKAGIMMNKPHHPSPEKEEAHAEMKSACAPYIDQVVEVLDDISRSMKELNKALDELLACLEK